MIDLDDTILFDSYRWKENHELKSLYNFLLTSIETSSMSYKIIENVKACAKYFLCSLYDAYQLDKCIALALREEEFSKGRYAQLHIKSRAFKAVLGTILDIGWAGEKIGFRAQKGYSQGRMTRIYPSGKLVEFFDGIECYPEKKASDIICVTDIIDGKKQLVEFAENTYTIELREKLTQINEVLANNVFRYEQAEKIKVKNPFLKGHPEPENAPRGIFKRKKHLYPRLKASFCNGSTTEGGRLYCNPLKGASYQSLSPNVRANITINGKSVCEGDYGAMHIAILYAVEGLPLDGDPYDIGIPGIRPVIKKLLLSILNASDDNAVIKSINKEHYEMLKKEYIPERDLNFWEAFWGADIDVKTLINCLRNKHNPIKKYFCSGSGVFLQNLDSQLIISVITHFTDRDIPCLPLHDSVIIAERYKEELKQVMQKKFFKAFKQNCKVDF